MRYIQKQEKNQNIPVGRIANMSEITDTVMFLCKNSSYITLDN